MTNLIDRLFIIIRVVQLKHGFNLFCSHIFCIGLVQPNRTTPNLSFRPRVRTGGVLMARKPFNPRSNIICHTCGTPGHISKDCRKPKIVCFGCGQEGHVRPNCPNKTADGGFNKGGARPGGNGGFPARGGNNGRNKNDKRGRPVGRLNCTSLEADNSEAAVLGTLSLLTHYGKVLFDTDATTSFLAKHFVDQYGISCTPLEYPITVVSACGTLLVTHIKLDQVITICNCT